MFDHLTNPVLIETRAAVARFIEDELRPLERELGLGTEDPWPREVLRNVWRRSSELGLYAACLRSLAEKGSTSRSSARSRLTLPPAGRYWRRTCWETSVARRA